ncbi:hypothetical protein LR48_Vigan07g119100 [Vigna angularis]|uniref:Uncharacterized protein n=1 Tax=Phaseolus angularis TaxID=3914 RepID=A0A0L9UY36_PHAAN|nr:hypothetical protein LR48_Vigan07g119100 [Vigna angularis]
MVTATIVLEELAYLKRSEMRSLPPNFQIDLVGGATFPCQRPSVNVSDKQFSDGQFVIANSSCISLDEFITRMSWPEDQAQASGGGGMSGAKAMAKDEEDDEEDSNAFEGSDGS